MKLNDLYIFNINSNIIIKKYFKTNFFINVNKTINKTYVFMFLHLSKFVKR